MLMERRELVRYVGGKLARFGDGMQKKLKTDLQGRMLKMLD